MRIVTKFLLLLVLLMVSVGCTMSPHNEPEKPYSVSGSVVNTWGMPLSGVKLVTHYDNEYVITTTDSEGKFTFVGLKGEVVIRVLDYYIGPYRKYGFTPRSQTIHSEAEGVQFVGILLYR